MSPTELSEAANISVPYASQILSGARIPARSLAIHIFRKTGWRHSMLDGLSDEHMDVLEAVDPWTPSKAQAA